MRLRAIWAVPRQAKVRQLRIEILQCTTTERPGNMEATTRSGIHYYYFTVLQWGILFGAIAT